MAGDVEIEQLRAAVSCPLLLERQGYKLDTRESSRHNPKYRRGAGEIIIVNHDGQGWWDPKSSAKAMCSSWRSFSTPRSTSARCDAICANSSDSGRVIHRPIGKSRNARPGSRPSCAVPCTSPSRLGQPLGATWSESAG